MVGGEDNFLGLHFGCHLDVRVHVCLVSAWGIRIGLCIGFCFHVCISVRLNFCLDARARLAYYLGSRIGFSRGLHFSVHFGVRLGFCFC